MLLYYLLGYRDETTNLEKKDGQMTANDPDNHFHGGYHTHHHYHYGKLQDVKVRFLTTNTTKSIVLDTLLL